MNQSERKMIKRNLLTSSLCLVLLLMMLLSSTLAWFTDTTGNVNTMVAGKISIEQKEYSDAGHTVEFENNKYVMMPNVSVTKEVVVTNTGDQAAYVRTLVAFEDKVYVDENGGSKSVVDLLTVSGLITIDKDVQFTVTNGTETTLYTVGYYIHDAALAVDGTINPLDGITLNPAADNKWHEAVGATYEVIVLSQATQVAGMEGLTAAQALNTAFKPIDSASCALWFAKVVNGTASGSTITVNNP